MKTIITHRHPDLDAVTGVYLYIKMNREKDYEINYLPEVGNVYIDCVPDLKIDVEIYDHHSRDTLYKSATEVVFKNLEHKVSDKNELKAYSMIVDAVNLIDNAKLPDRVYLPVMFDTYIYGLNISNIGKDNFWKKVFSYYDNVLQSLLLDIKSQQVPYRIEIVNNFKIAYYELSSDENLNPAPFLFSKMGVDFVVYKHGNNIGIVREATLTNPSLEYLKDLIKENNWFFHPRGFIAAWGTAKYPARKPSKYSIYDIVEILKEFLKNYTK